MSMQLCSDTHLELCSDDYEFNKILIPSANYVCLLGDIGYPTHPNYKGFINYCSNNFKKVFVISGNHEYYATWCLNTSYDFHDINFLIESICEKYSNVYYLNNRIHVMDEHKYIILGTTLWSNIPLEYYNYITDNINDYRRIFYTRKHNMTPDHVNRMFNENKRWLLDTILTQHEQCKDYKIMILTHHLPSFDLIHEKYLGNINNSDIINMAFASDLDAEIQSIIGLKYWFFGHTHKSTDKYLFDSRFIANPYGYRGNNCEYKNNLVIDLEE